MMNRVHNPLEGPVGVRSCCASPVPLPLPSSQDGSEVDAAVPRLQALGIAL